MDREIHEAATQLVNAGVDEHIVASSLGLPLSDVKQLYASRTQVTTRLNEEDARLAEAMRKLAWRAYEEAMNTLEFGSPARKDGLIRAVLGRTMGLVGMENTQRFDELRTDFEAMMADIRGGSTVLEEPDDAEAVALTIDSYNPNQGSDDRAV